MDTKTDLQVLSKMKSFKSQGWKTIQDGSLSRMEAIMPTWLVHSSDGVELDAELDEEVDAKYLVPFPGDAKRCCAEGCCCWATAGLPIAGHL